MSYRFLSDEWLAEVSKLTAEAGGGLMPDTVQLNMVVTGGPDGDRQLHVTGGAFAVGLLDGCPTKLTVPYQVAKDMFIKGDQAAAMQAFMSGQIKVEGDRSKLMAMGGPSAGAASPEQAALQTKLREITADV